MTDSGVLAELLALERSGFAAAERWSPASWDSELSQTSLEVLGWRDHRVLSLSKDLSLSKVLSLSKDLNPSSTELLGVIALRYGGDTVDLDRIVVDPRARRQGIGHKLITAGLRRATARGATEMILEVRTDNEPAIKLYRSFGFTEVTVRTGYYGPAVDALLMSRRLEQA